MTLYRKHRSHRFSDLVGQEAITKTLVNAVTADKVSHAYIFSGPRGTGKTSAARILAKAVNCLNPEEGEPCNKCEVCLQISESNSMDIIEIDAASHTGVEDVRDIIEKIEFAPVKLKKKIYIVDEAHMLSRSAFNALLKTLEEPPVHVMFILATTEIHKIPVTILSRCQRFDFKLGSVEKLIFNLKRIVEKEGFSIDEDALEYIASSGNGSYRDSITILEKIVSNTGVVNDAKITKGEVLNVLGIPDFELVKNFGVALLRKDAVDALAIIDTLMERGIDVRQFHKSLLEYLRSQIVKHMKFGATDIDASLPQILMVTKIIGQMQKYESFSVIPVLPLELSVAEICKDEIIVASNPVKKTGKNRAGIKKSNAIQKITKKVNSLSKTKLSLEEIRNRWVEVVELVKPFNGHLFAFLAKSELKSFEDGVLEITVPFEFYKERIEDSKGKSVISECLKKVFDEDFSVKCRVGKVKKTSLSPEEEEKIIDDALEVFGEDVV